MDISKLPDGLKRYIETLAQRLNVEPISVLQNIIIFHMASKQAKLDLNDDVDYPEFGKDENGYFLNPKKLFEGLTDYFKYQEIEDRIDRVNNKYKYALVGSKGVPSPEGFKSWMKTLDQFYGERKPLEEELEKMKKRLVPNLPDREERIRKWIEDISKSPDQHALEYERKKNPGKSDEEIKKQFIEWNINHVRSLYPKDATDEQIIEWQGLREDYPCFFE